MPPFSYRDLLQYAAWALEVFSHFMKTPPPPSTGGSSAPSTAAPPTPAPKPPPEPPEHHVVRNGLIATLLRCAILLSCCVLVSCIFGGWIVNTVKERTQTVQPAGQGGTGGQGQAPVPPQETPTPAPTSTPSPTDILRQWGYSVQFGGNCAVERPIGTPATIRVTKGSDLGLCEVLFNGGPHQVVAMYQNDTNDYLRADGQRYNIKSATFRAP